MNTQSNTELDTIIELTDSLNPQANTAPLSMTQNEVQKNKHNTMQDEAVFETLTAPKITNGASFMPPYADTPQAAQNTQTVAPADVVNNTQTAGHENVYNDEIIELDSNTVVQPQYTVTTELFLEPLEFGQKSKQTVKTDKVESMHIDTVHADAMHISEMHINTIHAAKMYDNMKEQEGAQVGHGMSEEDWHTTNKATAEQKHIEYTAEPRTQSKEYHVEAQAPTQPKYIQQMMRDVSTLQTTIASMQLRLAAQDACIASLESRLMAAEAKNRELEVTCRNHEKLSVQAPQVDAALLEKMTASTAARIVREEIQALLELAERQ